MAVSGLATAAVAVAIWWVVRDDPVERGYTSRARPSAPEHRRVGIWAGLRRVLGYRNIRLLFLVPGGLVGSVLTFSGLWGVPYLETVYGLSPARAAGPRGGFPVGPVAGLRRGRPSKGRSDSGADT